MTLGLFPFLGLFLQLRCRCAPCFRVLRNFKNSYLKVVLHTHHCFSMGAPRQLEQLHSFKRVYDILPHLLQGTVVPSDGLQEITTYTSTVECIPTLVARVIAMLPRYSKSDQIFQNFPGIPVFYTKRGQEQGLGRAFVSCSFHATPGRRLQMNSQRIQAPSNNRITANHRCSGLSEPARRQETEHHESLICCITLA
jgi:hypothetical protein